MNTQYIPEDHVFRDSVLQSELAAGRLVPWKRELISGRLWYRRLAEIKGVPRELESESTAGLEIKAPASGGGSLCGTVPSDAVEIIEAVDGRTILIFGKSDEVSDAFA